MTGQKQLWLPLITREMSAHLAIRRFVLGMMAMSVAANVLLAGVLLTKEDKTMTVVLGPTTGESYWVMKDHVSPELLERFGSLSLSLILNLTPATAAAQVERFLTVVAPESFGEMAALLRREAGAIIKNGATVAFFPESVRVDAKAGLMCLTGRRQTTIARTVTADDVTTACMNTVVRSGRLWIRAVKTEVNLKDSTTLMNTMRDAIDRQQRDDVAQKK